MDRQNKLLAYIAVMLTLIALTQAYQVAEMIFNRPVTDAELRALSQSGQDEKFELRRSQIPMVRVFGTADVEVQGEVDVHVTNDLDVNVQNTVDVHVER